VHQLLIDLKEDYDSVRGRSFYNILIEFGVPMELVRLIKMCLNFTHCRIRLGKRLLDTFLVKDILKQRDA
jgi:hypothetical protein